MKRLLTEFKLQEAIKKVEEHDNKDDGNGGPYVNEIYDYTKYLEHAYAVKPRFLDGHKEVSHKMRTILVDWIVQVHQRFKLQNETLHLTVAIMDRYLSKVPDLPRKEMQMIGLTAMLLASKYEGSQKLAPDFTNTFKKSTCRIWVTSSLSATTPSPEVKKMPQL